MIFYVANTDIKIDTIRVVGEHTYFAFRESWMPNWPTKNGVWWRINPDGTVDSVSLAYGAQLHGWTNDEYWDWETYDGAKICCHGGFVEAEACALHYFLHGHLCAVPSAEHKEDDE